MEQENKDLCKTCEHYWTDFPLPLERHIPHCEVVDKKIGFNNMDEFVSYPCLECPFNCYYKKK